jgi:hypothetical protein
MSLAQFRSTTGRNGSGRFVVSEGVAPASYLLPSVALPTWYSDVEDDRFETVIPKGTILSVVMDANNDSRLVPANGTASTQAWGDADTIDLETGATPTDVVGDTDTLTVAARTVPVGCAQYDLYRPFDKGTSQGGGWITHGYVEWPLIQGLNADIEPGFVITADHMGRPLGNNTAAHGDNSELSNYPYLAVGKCVEVEYFATNFDDGLLSYMQLPSDPGALADVYEVTKRGPNQGKLGIRGNLDVADVVGAFRVSLTL